MRGFCGFLWVHSVQITILAVYPRSAIRSGLIPMQLPLVFQVRGPRQTRLVLSAHQSDFREGSKISKTSEMSSYCLVLEKARL